MKPGELILIAILVLVSFILSDTIVDAVAATGAVERLFLRVGFLGQYFALIYLVFESRDNARRLREMERWEHDDCDDKDGAVGDGTESGNEAS